MPCLTLKNTPLNWFPNTDNVERLLLDLGQALGSNPKTVQLHISEERFLTVFTYPPSGSPTAMGHGVHGQLEMHSTRTEKQLSQAGSSIQRFLGKEGLGKGSDITVPTKDGLRFIIEGQLEPLHKKPRRRKTRKKK